MPHRKHRSCSLIADFALLGVVSNTLTNMVLAAATPNVERQLEANDEDALAELSSSVAQCMFARDGIESRVLLWIIIRWVWQPFRVSAMPPKSQSEGRGQQ